MPRDRDAIIIVLREGVDPDSLSADTLNEITRLLDPEIILRVHRWRSPLAAVGCENHDVN